jgi:hypothetical protein
MYTYSLIANSTSIRRSDGATIPADPANTDYAAYLTWVADGNTATPVPGITLAQAQSIISLALNTACQNTIYAGFSSSALGTPYTYPSQYTDQLNLNSSVNAANIVLTSPGWVAGATVTAGTMISMNGQGFVCTTPGVSGTSEPNWNITTGNTVTDGSVVWSIWTTLFWCEDSTGLWAMVPHTATQIRQVGMDGIAAVVPILQKNQGLQVQVATATTVEAVQSIMWS